MPSFRKCCGTSRRNPRPACIPSSPWRCPRATAACPSSPTRTASAASSASRTAPPRPLRSSRSSSPPPPPPAEGEPAPKIPKKYRMVLYVDRCIHCARCAEVCARNAITMDERFELAGFDHKSPPGDHGTREEMTPGPGPGARLMELLARAKAGGQPIVLMGIGNVFRGDDAIGHLLAQGLAEADLPGLKAFPVGISLENATPPAGPPPGARPHPRGRRLGSGAAPGRVGASSTRTPWAASSTAPTACPSASSSPTGGRSCPAWTSTSSA